MKKQKLPKVVGTLKVSDFLKLSKPIAQKLELNLAYNSNFKKLVQHYLISLN